MGGEGANEVGEGGADGDLDLFTRGQGSRQLDLVVLELAVIDFVFRTTKTIKIEEKNCGRQLRERGRDMNEEQEEVVGEKEKRIRKEGKEDGKER